MEKKERLMSLDALRGADMLCIMGVSEAVVALCGIFGMPDCWLAMQMQHVAWHGFRHHDTIFPLFLFLAGVAWPFSFAGQVARGRSQAAILRKVVVRMLILVFLGFATTRFFAFDFGKVRYASVLGHIGVGWAVAATTSMFVRGVRTRIALIVAILVGYWALLSFVVAPDAAAIVASSDPAIASKVASYSQYGTDGFSFVGNMVGWFDRRFLPGSLYEIVFDPEGILSAVSAVATALMGVLAGELLRRTDVSGSRKTALLLASAAVCAAICAAWTPWCPVNKKLWTPTFVLLSGAYSLAMLALFYWIVDVKKWRSWTFPFRVVGMNALTIYLMMRVVGFRSMSKFFFSGVASLGDASWSALVLSLGHALIGWLVLYFLYRKGTFFRV